MSSIASRLITETLEYDGGRQVTAYVPPAPPEARKPEAPKPNATEVPVDKPAPAPKDTVAAPAEAPSEVKPETGNEGAMATGKPAVEAGVEN